jgi:hypothetical protein
MKCHNYCGRVLHRLLPVKQAARRQRSLALEQALPAARGKTHSPCRASCARWET